MDRFERTVTMDVEDYYKVVNALREQCGCADCQRIANDIMDQMKAQREAMA